MALFHALIVAIVGGIVFAIFFFRAYGNDPCFHGTIIQKLHVFFFGIWNEDMQQFEVKGCWVRFDEYLWLTKHHWLQV
ncbi:MAG: hypothetical protein EZS28_022810 [Streblomastix strix]|uniref:Transmembrane protein n=1 Tax=Streblomastix strix TaxID=222440 RepID=A0A5J4VH21_9EUKA|nr:MAG: hypothetical protein EZS28_022810 [Streblomastix strix]